MIPVAISRRNLITNPSFEVDVTSDLGFENNGTGGVISIERITTNTAIDGSSAHIMLGSIPETENWRYKYRANATSGIQVTEGKIYSISAYIRTSDARTIQFALEGEVPLYAPPFATTTEWQRYQHFLTNDVGTGNDTFNFLINNGSAGDVYIDGLMVEEISTDYGYMDGNSGDGFAWEGTPGLSQSIEQEFIRLAKAQIRPINYGVFISFLKNYTADTHFFTIGQSAIGGPDIIKGNGDVVQEWDKYDYQEYTFRLVSLEWTRQEDQLSNISLAMADVVLDNHDGYFDIDTDSEIEDHVLPSRPIRIYAGFGSERVQVFVGITQGMPEIDQKTRTVRFHAIDFLSLLMNKVIGTTITQINKRTDEILGVLLQNAGLLPSQYSLDVAYNSPGYAFFDQTETFGESASNLMEAEGGRLFLDENGILRFRNRQNFNSLSVYAFDTANIVDYQFKNQDSIINTVEVKGTSRIATAVEDEFVLGSPITITAGTSTDYFAQFDDPAISIETPVAGITVGTSYYVANDQIDGGGTDATLDISLTFTELYSKSALFRFNNPTDHDIYVTILRVDGVFALATSTIDEVQTDSASVAKYDQLPDPPLVIENDFIQTIADARGKALTLIRDNSEFIGASEINVKGTPSLQIGDIITITL